MVTSVIIRSGSSSCPALSVLSKLAKVATGHGPGPELARAQPCSAAHDAVGADVGQPVLLELLVRASVVEATLHGAQPALAARLGGAS